MVNKQALDALTPEQREVLARADGAAEERGWQTSDKNAQDTVKVLKDNGAKVGNLDTSVAARMDKAGASLAVEAFKRADPEWLKVLSSFTASKQARGACPAKSAYC